MNTLQIIEITAACIGILYVVLEVKASKWLWPVGVVLPFFYIYLSWVGQMYGNIAVNLYYLAAAVWGWWLWNKRSSESPEADLIAYAPRHSLLWLGGIGVVAVLLLAPIFRHYMGSPYPWGDTIATVISCMGMWLLAKKYIENWYCWIISNAIFCVLFYLQGMQITSAFYLVYTLFAVVGWINWLRLYRRQSSL